MRIRKPAHCMPAIILALLLFQAFSSSAAEIVLEGTQASRVKIVMREIVDPFPGMKTLELRFVEPKSFESPTYRQKIDALRFEFDPAPASRIQEIDDTGNRVHIVHWSSVDSPVRASLTYEAEVQAKAIALTTDAPYPPTDLPSELDLYLQPSPQVQSSHKRIKTLSRELTVGASDQYEVVMAVMRHVIDNMEYILLPEHFDALSCLTTGKGNCQNYSHLAAALLRAAGVPVRIVNGITLKKPYSLEAGAYTYSFESAQGRHSWIEVWFPETGWLPFDPQRTAWWVETRYIRVEVGRDNADTDQDGTVQWSALRGSPGQPRVDEQIEVTFLRDQIALRTVGEEPGTEEVLLRPVIGRDTPASKTPSRPSPEKPRDETPEEIDYASLTYNVPYTYGNKEFPRLFNFLEARIAGPDRSNRNRLEKNFVVETAEYVTGPKVFAQYFDPGSPLLLEEIKLALFSFGGDGSLWIDLHEDEGGRPGIRLASSQPVSPSDFMNPKGYDWVAFDFRRESLGLGPGGYWMVLRSRGAPIVNWFYCYGKAVGPARGTLSTPQDGETFTTIQTYEFNYMIAGKGAKELMEE
ncbi:hypothetical protein GF324_03005 [bacterium]|nr:hypothetical protein [bacterium]